MKYNKIAMLVASGMMMASVGGTSLGNATSVLDAQSDITANVSGYAVLEVLDDMAFGGLALNADKKFYATKTSQICVALANDSASRGNLSADPKTSITIDDTLVGYDLTWDANGWGNNYTLTANLPKLIRTDPTAVGSDELDVLSYTATLGPTQTLLGPDSEPSENKNISSCTTPVNELTVAIDDANIAQNPGSYSADITLSIASS